LQSASNAIWGISPIQSVKGVSSTKATGAKTRAIVFPIGGIGSGSIGLAGNGSLVDREIFNRPCAESRNGFSHFAVRAQREGKL